MTAGFGIGASMRNARRVATACALAAALGALAVLGGCSGEQHELALVASAKNAELTEARNDEQDDFVLDVDARERASLDRELDLIAQLGEAHIEAKFAADLAEATEFVASAVGAESRPLVAPESRKVVAAEKVRALVTQQNKDRAATRDAIAKQRKEITERLDAELKKWLADPKKRQQERIAAALKVYAAENSAFARFVEQTKADVGLAGVLK
jgi:hypothetical protein